ncbi:MAG: hypothetical protein R2942_13485 [Ignavibacteria bacterium]
MESVLRLCWVISEVISNSRMKLYTFAGRFSGGISFGANPMQFFIGGTDNWINYEYTKL